DGPTAGRTVPSDCDAESEPAMARPSYRHRPESQELERIEAGTAAGFSDRPGTIRTSYSGEQLVLRMAAEYAATRASVNDARRARERRGSVMGAQAGRRLPVRCPS